MAVTGAQMLRQQISTKVWPQWILISINYFLTICDIHNNWTVIHNEIDIAYIECIYTCEYRVCKCCDVQKPETILKSELNVKHGGK